LTKDSLNELLNTEDMESILEFKKHCDTSDLSDFNFVDEPFLKYPAHAKDYEYTCNLVAFRIINSTENELFVVLTNCHNGYYSHGFESFCGEGEL
jgi:hypothetical protein